MNNRLVISSTIGYMCLGLTIWMVNLGSTHWVAGPNMEATVMMFTLGTAVLGVMAILSFFHGRTLDAIIFFGAAGWFLTVSHSAMGHMAATSDSSGTMGWYYLVWAIFIFYVWIASFKSGWARSLFLLAAWISVLAMALNAWLAMDVFAYIAGYLGLVAGLVATYISAATIVNHGCGKTCLPGNPGDAS
ncbi:MAG: GPR1/FUN34/YaaH family transporter [Gammaproteobacteria bacterium]|nr:GPR1/FUN34/YaaH family transporter [Gammaproteobacteria bacterium]MBU6509358.1 GPR1/FUN34/YaaH family transporter [Gammaproteobacteria bacterium]MDE1983569.1 GPR1/FUN34/YaaH family transporter [Gammaproteobacteria bacterium]MDE2107702.1 GPR1/FUN34/YaaH family transporter [Gammaproteobacteria bacterium]MDE2460505.1 GPR1/FUN34/YaaH family transporter [Gammaproteobacteria bacterium]